MGFILGMILGAVFGVAIMAVFIGGGGDDE